MLISSSSDRTVTAASTSPPLNTGATASPAGHGHLYAAPVSLPNTAAPTRVANRAIALWEIALFAVICSADMLSTVYLYERGVATESNPLLAYWLQKSVTAFCVAKLASFVPLLLICVVYRKTYSQFIVTALRIAMAAYIAIYLIAVGVQFLPR